MDLLIDGDIVAYRCACAVDNNDEPTAKAVYGTIDSFMAWQFLRASQYWDAESLDYRVYLTDDFVFRESVAVTAPYKGQRDSSNRPSFYHEARQYLVDTWGAIKQEPYEADDLIAIQASCEPLNSVIVSCDKDFEQVPVPYLHMVSGRARPAYSAFVCNVKLYAQCLAGDNVDNIIGVYGMGPHSAEEVLCSCRNESEMALFCVDQLGYDRFIENMELVYLLRSADDWYVPPTEVFDAENYTLEVFDGSEEAQRRRNLQQLQGVFEARREEVA